MPRLFFSPFNKETWQRTLYFCTGIERSLKQVKGLNINYANLIKQNYVLQLFDVACC